MSWLTREDLTASARSATGLLAVSPDATTVVPAASPASFAGALRAVGVGAADRVVVALSNDGEGAGTGWAAGAAEVAAAAASAGPRGRLRLHRVLETVGATVLVITPTGAMDLLARLHLEFLLDPLDLGLATIVLTGEIASKATMAQLASEFECDVVEVYADPFSGAPLAWRGAESEPLTVLGDGLGLAAIGKDVLLEPPYPPGLAELVVSSAESTVRTGQVVEVVGEGIPAPCHTVGEQLLIRGRWLSIPRIEQAMGRIDGVACWELRVSREGTLDAAALHVTFMRDTLVRNPMWKSRIRQALVALTPITVEVVVQEEISETAKPGTVTDLRGHHLGRDRSAVTE